MRRTNGDPAIGFCLENQLLPRSRSSVFVTGPGRSGAGPGRGGSLLGKAGNSYSCYGIVTFGVMAVKISGARGHFGEGRQLTCHTYAFSESIEFQGLEKGSEAFRVIP